MAARRITFSLQRHLHYLIDKSPKDLNRYQPFPFQPVAGQIAVCDTTKCRHQLHQSYLPIVNDKTNPLPCPPTFI